MKRTSIVSALAVALAGCGGSEDGRNRGTAATASSGWDERDACKAMPKERVGALLGGTIIKSELAAVQDDRNYDTFSQCSFELADGRVAVVGTGHLVGDDTLAARVEKQRAEAAAITSPIETLQGVGKAALYAPKMNMVWAFLDNGRYLQINLAHVTVGDATTPPDKMKADVIALARALGA